MRPSESRCHQRPGKSITAPPSSRPRRTSRPRSATARTSSLQKCSGTPALRFSALRKSRGMRKLLPHLRQERRAATRRARGSRRRRRAAAAPAPRPRSRRTIARSGRAATPRWWSPSNSSRDKRREARIAKRRGDRVGAHVVGERPPRADRADAAAQVARDAQRDERRADRAQARGGAAPRCGRGRPSSRAMAPRASASSGDADVSAARPSSAKVERRVADHARAVARGVARVAQVEQRRREAALLRAPQEAVDRRRAARLLVIERGRQREDGVRRSRGRCDALPRRDDSATDPS